MAGISTRNDIPLSVVVPVYNVEKYLSRCINSLLKTKDIDRCEIILVDDGSTDKSGDIADRYANEYSTVFCYHKENGGLSDARNYGLKQAKGRYVFFCDSDDMVIAEGFGRLIAAASKNNVDVILFDGAVIDEDDHFTDSELGLILDHSGLTEGKLITGTEAMVGQIEDHNKVAMTAWLKACRRDFLIKNELYFEPGLIHEDELWTPTLLTTARNVMYLHEKVYCYRTRKDSIMTSAPADMEKHADALVRIMNRVYDLYMKKTSDSDQKTLLANWADTYLWIISKYEMYRFDISRDVPCDKISSCAKNYKSKIKAGVLTGPGMKAYCNMFKA